MNEGDLRSIPNIFYDFIVFVTPTLLFAIGCVIGVFGIETIATFTFPSLDLSNLIWIVIVGLLLSYEFGRIAETWSSMVVQTPLKVIRRLIPLFRNPDFLAPYPNVFAELGLKPTSSTRDGDKWSIYFFAFVADNRLGSDLLKRYAWEKLARSSSFTYLTLALVSEGFCLMRWIGIGILPPHAGFTSPLFGPVALFLAAVTAIEYYKRNVWNHDLLRKTVPILLEARRLLESRNDQAVNIYLGRRPGRVSARREDL